MLEQNTYKVGIYMRLSREDEGKTTESESIKNQRNFILEYTKKEQLLVIDEYIDDGISGTTFDRKEFNRMIQDIESKKINMVITKDFSRLGRDYIEAGHYAEKYFPEKRVRYVSINDGIDTYLDTLGNEMLPFKAVINDFYCKDISKKIKSTLNTKKRQGLFLGSQAPYGYLKDPVNKYHLIIDPVASEVVRTIYKMFLENNSLQKIAQHLTEQKIARPSVHKGMNYKDNEKTKAIWDERTIDDILKNPNYTGNLTQCRRKKINYKSKKIIHTNSNDWIVVENTHEAIIDSETFNLVQNVYDKNRNISTHSQDILLKGFLYCKECGHTLGINKSSDKTRHYTICNHYRKYAKQSFCTCHSMRYEDLEKLVLNDIRKKCKECIDVRHFESIIKNNNKKTKVLQDINKRIENANNIIQSHRQNMEQMYLDKLNKKVTDEIYQNVFQKLEKEINESEALIKSLELEQKSLLNNKLYDNDNYKEKIKTFLSFQKPDRKLLASIINKIEIDENKNIDIYYKIKPLFNSIHNRGD